MNKRAAMPDASSSDTNDRTEPLVGANVVLRLLEDSRGGPREATLRWVVELLFPSLYGWNQWAWRMRRWVGLVVPWGRIPFPGPDRVLVLLVHSYRVGTPGGGLLVLGSDNTLPCEGSTIGLNTSKQICASRYAAILESGMDNSPMYVTRVAAGMSPRYHADWRALAPTRHNGLYGSVGTITPSTRAPPTPLGPAGMPRRIVSSSMTASTRHCLWSSRKPCR